MEENDLICLPDPDREQVSDQSKVEHFGTGLPPQASTRAPTRRVGGHRPTRRVGGNRPSRHQAAQHAPDDADPPAAANPNNLEQPSPSSVPPTSTPTTSTPLKPPILHVASPQQQLGGTTRNNNIQNIQALHRGKQARLASVAVKKGQDRQKKQKKRQHAKQEKERRWSAARQLQRQIRGMLARRSCVALREKEERRREKLEIEHSLRALREKRNLEKDKERKRVEQEMRRRNEFRGNWLRCSQKQEEEQMEEQKKVNKEKDIERKTAVEGMDKEDRQGREERKLALSSSPPFLSSSSSSSTSTSTSTSTYTLNMSLPDLSNEFSHLSPTEALDIFVELTKEKETKQTLLTNLLQQERAASTRVNMLSRSIQEKKRRIQKLKIPSNPEKKRKELENMIQKSKEKIKNTKKRNESHRQEMKSKIQQLQDLVKTKKREFARIMEQVEMLKCDEEDMNQMLGIVALR